MMSKSEISIPGGSVDYFLVSARNGKVRDFVGIEIQTLDTTGTVWPERQRLLKDLGVSRDDECGKSSKSYGMNWKMTAKTILVQMHHKIHTFEHVNKKLVLVIQDKLLNYMRREFNFSHLCNPARIGDSTHLHAYRMDLQADNSYKGTSKNPFFGLSSPRGVVGDPVRKHTRRQRQTGFPLTSCGNDNL